MSILQLVTIAFLGIVFLLFLMAFLATFLNYRGIKKRIRYDQERIEKGDSVLLKDSFLSKALYYADKDFTQKDIKDELNIFTVLAFIKLVFTLTQICLLFGLIGVIVLFFKEFSGGNELTLSAFTVTVFPVLVCVIVSFLLIIYIKVIYTKLYVNQAYDQIKKNNDLLNNLHTKILVSISPPSDANFYALLEKETLDGLNAKLLSDGPTQTFIEKRLVALSMRDYFMKEVPDYNNSEIKKLFTSDAASRTKDPANYIRIDCTQTIQSYVYKHDVVLKQITRLQDKDKANAILSNVSKTLGEINAQISQFRQKSEPMVVLLENYFRVGTLYLFFMVAIVFALIVSWYGLGCKLGKGVAGIKYGALKVWGVIRKLWKKEDERKTYNDEIEDDFVKAMDKECIQTAPAKQPAGATP